MYAALAAAGVPLHIVVPYDNVAEEVYTWLVNLPCAAIGLDFCGVPGAAHGCATAQLIAKHGFPKVTASFTLFMPLILLAAVVLFH